MKSLLTTIILFLALLSFAKTKPTLILTTQKNDLENKAHIKLNNLPNFTDTKIDFATIDSLRIGEQYLINVESNGCFHHSELYLIISKSSNGYYSEFNMTGKIEGTKVRNVFKKRKINTLAVDSIRAFEFKIFQISKQSYGCTTVDNYYLIQGQKKCLYCRRL